MEAPRQRPLLISVAAVLLGLGGVHGLALRLVSLPRTVDAAGWIVIHSMALVLAYGAWRLDRWAYWGLVSFAILGLAFVIARLAFLPGPLGTVYQLVRAFVLFGWLVYFSRPQVRGAFRLGNGRQRDDPGTAESSA